MPDVAALAGWVAGHRGIAADLHAYRLDRSLEPQIAAGIIRALRGRPLLPGPGPREPLSAFAKDSVTDEIG